MMASVAEQVVLPRPEGRRAGGKDRAVCVRRQDTSTATYIFSHGLGHAGGELRVEGVKTEGAGAQR